VGALEAVGKRSDPTIRELVQLGATRAEHRIEVVSAHAAPALAPNLRR